MRGKWLLLTFGAGLPNWRAAANRVARQAHESGWFREVLVYDEKRLYRDFPQFFTAHERVLKPSVRGFGWWIWKPFLVARALEYGTTCGFDGVIYLDAGFEINTRTPRCKSRLAQYFEAAHDIGSVFAMHLPGHSERTWSREIVMNQFSLTTEARVAPQVQATPVLAVTQESRDIAESWQSACIANEYALVRDPPRDEVNPVEFQDHRHDQSVFSCLLKSQSIPTIPDETFWAPTWSTSGRDYPLWAARNRTRVSITEAGLRGRVIRFSEKAYSRVHSDFIGPRRFPST